MLRAFSSKVRFHSLPFCACVDVHARACVCKSNCAWCIICNFFFLFCLCAANTLTLLAAFRNFPLIYVPLSFPRFTVPGDCLNAVRYPASFICRRNRFNCASDED